MPRVDLGISNDEVGKLQKRASHTSAVLDDGVEVDVDYEPPKYWKRRSSSFSRPSRAALFGMTRVQEEPKDFNVAFVGAGNINFGSDEGPWNHSIRLEEKIGPALRVVAIIDPDKNRTDAVLKAKRALDVKPAYEKTKHYASLESFIDWMRSHEKKTWPNAMIIGSPPAFRGSDKPNRDAELKILKGLPGMPMLVEKPVSTDTVAAVRVVSDFMLKSPHVVSMGYFLRYLKVVQKMKSIIREYNLQVMSTIGIYSASYAKIAKPAWWDTTKDLGPIIEQGTHFCDLSRYFGGDVDLDTVQSSAVYEDENVGKLSKVPIDESKIAPEHRIARATTANWKYKNGAVGTLVHSAVLQGTQYKCELQVYADGWLFRLLDPYNAPQLLVRSPEDDAETTYTFPGDDPYQSQMDAFIDTVNDGLEKSKGKILGSYEDAASTYELTWAITNAAERTRKEVRERKKVTKT